MVKAWAQVTGDGGLASDKRMAAPSQVAERIVRKREPLNLECPVEGLSSRLTDTELFYTRCHFAIPHLRPETYRLEVRGAVNKSLSLTYENLRALPSRTQVVTLECAGNGRAFLDPPAEGVQWHEGAVSTAEWRGVPLSEVLGRVGLQQGACEIVLQGADRGRPEQKPLPEGEIPYARSVSIEKVDDVLLAYEMNGAPLSEEHGFPLRAVVAGHYAMASVKWLTGVRVVTTPFYGYFQTIDYAYWDWNKEEPERRPLSAVALKSMIVRPAKRDQVAAGATCEILGAAWCGDSEVAKQEVSTDGGGHWETAEFLDPSTPGAWRHWHYSWKVPPEKGVYVLKCRATDERGRTQPAEHNLNYGGYVIDHILGTAVEVV